MRDRINIILICLGIISAFLLLFQFYGYENTWRLWNLDVMMPHFADNLGVLSWAEALAKGINPYEQSPFDPWGRISNYPKGWHLLYYAGLDTSHNTIVGLVLITSYFLGIILALPKANWWVLLLTTGFILSPGALLCIERAQLDLFLFFLVVLAVIALKRAPIVSTLALVFSFTLKVFPLVATVIFLRFRAKKCLLYLSLTVILTALTIYLFDVLAFTETTTKSGTICFGKDIVWLFITKHSEYWGSIAHILTYVLLAIIAIIASTAFFRSDFTQPTNDHEMMNLDLFRAGAAVYTAVFLHGGSYDYKLIFLILTIPQFVFWFSAKTRNIRLISKVIFFAFAMTLWEGYKLRALLLDEIADWFIFASLLYLLFWTIPEWLKKPMLATLKKASAK